MRIRLAHSPDPDDAFMFYGLACGAVDPHPYELVHIREDIQTLNERAARGEYEVTAISIHAYAYVRDKYALTSCGGSMGENYGPLLVAHRPLEVEQLAGRPIAVPGLLTTACLVLQLRLGRDGFRPLVVPFDRIPEAVAAGAAPAGVLIHEGQLTYSAGGLHLVSDLGRWWSGRTGLPLPLGGNAIRRDLGAAAAARLGAIIRASIRYGLEHRAAALRHAARYGRGLDGRLLERFVAMYVNEWTLDYGVRGRAAISRLLREGRAAGLLPETGPIDFVA